MVIAYIIYVLDLETVAQTCVCVGFRPLKTKHFCRMILICAIPNEAVKLTPLFFRGTFGELIEYVKITFVLDLTDDAPLFQKVIRYLGTDRFSVSVKHNLEIFSLG
jgi:hypothetical protein